MSNQHDLHSQSATFLGATAFSLMVQFPEILPENPTRDT